MTNSEQYLQNVDWEKYGKSKREDLLEQYRITRVHFAQCSVSLSFDDFLKQQGIFLHTSQQTKQKGASHEG